MNEALREVFNKKEEELTEDDRTLAREAIDAFKKAVDEVCHEHGLAYKAVLTLTQEGILPGLTIVGLEEEKK